MHKDRGGPPETVRTRGDDSNRHCNSASVLNGTRRLSQEVRRNRLLNGAINKHGILGVGALLKSLEAEFGDLAIDRRLERLVDAEPAAVALLDGAGGAR
jgi:hypothetical protein